MVAQHVTRNIKPNGQYGLQYRVPELFTASGFATAQFLVDVTNAIPDLNTNLMINYLESGITIDTPKGPTYLRPDDHQGLAEMYIARAVNDTRPASETYNLIIADLVRTLDRNEVAPPIESGYTPGGFAPTTTGTTTETTTETTTGPTTGTTSETTSETTPVPTGFDVLTLTLIVGGVGVVLIIVIAVIWLRKK